MITIAGGALGAADPGGGRRLIAALGQLEGASPQQQQRCGSVGAEIRVSPARIPASPANASDINQNQPPNSTNNTLTNAVSNHATPQASRWATARQSQRRD